MIYFGCHRCKAAMSAPDCQAGENETCPECGERAMVPGSSSGTQGSVFDTFLPIEAIAAAEIAPVDSPLVTRSRRLRQIVDGSCPRCGASTTQKVSIVYAAGTTHTRQRGGALAFTDEGLVPVIGRGRSESQTVLASKLAPPTRTDSLAAIIVIGGFVFGFLGAVIVQLSWDGEKTGQTYLRGAGTFAVILALAVVVAVIQHRGATRHNKKAAHAYGIWDSSWLCQRCGAVFVPQTDD